MEAYIFFKNKMKKNSLCSGEVEAIKREIKCFDYTQRDKEIRAYIASKFRLKNNYPKYLINILKNKKK